MMKKLLILMLVLGLPSVAVAQLSAVAPVVAGPVTWDVIGDQLVGTGTSGGLNGFLWPATNGTLTPALSDSATPGLWLAAGDMASLSEPAAQMFATFAADATGQQVPGKWFSFDISGFTDPMTIEIWDTQTTSAGFITIIPEPMTIALFGLGSLFLLRRRK